MIVGGVFDAHPELQVVAGHSGGYAAVSVRGEIFLTMVRITIVRSIEFRVRTGPKAFTLRVRNSLPVDKFIAVLLEIITHGPVK